MKQNSSLISAAALLGLALAACDTGSPKATEPSSLSEPAVGAAVEGSAGALAAALRNPDPFARARRLAELLPTLGPESTPEIPELLDRFRRDLGAAEPELLLRFWASHEPVEATAWTFENAPPMYQNAAARAVIETWAEADPAAALVAADSALLDTGRDEVARIAQAALIRGWFRKDQSGLEDYIEGLGHGIPRQRALLAFLSALQSTEGSEAAVRWAESIPEDDQRWKLAVYRQLTSALAGTDEAAAMRFCDAHCGGPYGKGLRNILVRTRLNMGAYGGDVIGWVAQAPEETDEQRKNKEHALQTAWGFWAYRDRRAAVDWMREKLAQAQPEPWLPILYVRFARNLAADSPSEAIEWAERIEDEGKRQDTLVRIARAWRLEDEAAAEAWLNQSSLPEKARERARDGTLPSYLPTPE